MSTSKVFTGARAQFMIGEKFVGYSLGCTGVSGINYTPIQALGHLEVLEHAPTAYTVEMTSNLSRVVLGDGTKGTRLNTQDFTDTNETYVDSPQLMPAYGNNGGLAILESGELMGHVYDRLKAKTIYSIGGLKASQKSWDTAGAGAVAENITWVARFMNENGEGTTAVGV